MDLPLEPQEQLLQDGMDGHYQEGKKMNNLPQKKGGYHRLLAEEMMEEEDIPEEEVDLPEEEVAPQEEEEDLMEDPG